MNETVFHFMNAYPKIDSSVFVASGAKIIGDVIVHKNCSIWFNSVVRGDVQSIAIGESTNIQDNCILHVTNKVGPLNIGSNVTVGHGAILHACTVNDYTFVGMGAILLDNCIVEPYSMIAAGSLITQRFIVPSGMLVAGVPAKVIRELTNNEKDNIATSAKRYVTYAESYKSQNA